MWIFPGSMVLEAPTRRSSVENFYWLVARITFRGLKPVIPAFDHAHGVDIPSGEADLNTHSHTHTRDYRHCLWTYAHTLTLIQRALYCCGVLLFVCMFCVKYTEGDFELAVCSMNSVFNHLKKEKEIRIDVLI